MPTYEYKCDACGQVFEKFQSITAAPLRKCLHCGRSGVRRLIGTGAGLIFKGSGFYITDYRSDSYKSAAKSDGAPKTDTAKSNGAKSESSAKSDTSSSAKPAASTPPAAKKK